VHGITKYRTSINHKAIIRKHKKGSKQIKGSKNRMNREFPEQKNTTLTAKKQMDREKIKNKN